MSPIAAIAVPRAMNARRVNSVTSGAELSGSDSELSEPDLMLSGCVSGVIRAGELFAAWHRL